MSSIPLGRGVDFDNFPLSLGASLLIGGGLPGVGGGLLGVGGVGRRDFGQQTELPRPAIALRGVTSWWRAERDVCLRRRRGR